MIKRWRGWLLCAVLFAAVWMPIRGPGEGGVRARTEKPERREPFSFCARRELSVSGKKQRLSRMELVLVRGERYRLQIRGNTSGQQIRWKSTRPKIASVTGRGLVRAKHCGTARIRAYAGTGKMTCRVRVIRASLSAKKLVMRVGEKKQLVCKSRVPVRRWSSSDSRVAKISKKGVIRARKAGKCDIFVSIGQSVLKCRVLVKSKREEPEETMVTATSGYETGSSEDQPLTESAPPSETSPGEEAYQYRLICWNRKDLDLFVCEELPCEVLWFLKTEDPDADTIRIVPDGDARIVTLQFDDVYYIHPEEYSFNLKKVRGGWLVCFSYESAGTGQVTAQIRKQGKWVTVASEEVSILDGRSARNAWARQFLKKAGAVSGNVTERAMKLRDAVKTEYTYSRSRRASFPGDLKFTFDVGPLWEVKQNLSCVGAVQLMKWLLDEAGIRYRDAGDSTHAFLQIRDGDRWIDCDATPPVSSGVMTEGWQYINESP